MQNVRKMNRPGFISFSGIDGSGKTTQIDALCERLKSDGLIVTSIRFWDDIAKLTRLRDAIGHKVFRGDRGVGTPSTPINRRDKNVRSLFMTGLRLLLYSIDAISQKLVVTKALGSNVDLVIFDRYIYDELANLTLRNQVVRSYVRLIMRFVPKPDISFFLDADPMMARARKPEYPLEFLYVSRQSYLDLNNLIGVMTVITPKPIEETKQVVLGNTLAKVSFWRLEKASDKGVSSTEKSVEVTDREPALRGPATS